MEIKQHNNNTKEFFPITSVCKDDLFQLFSDDSRAIHVMEKLENGDMVNLAMQLANDYCEQLFWESLKAIFESEFLTIEVPSMGIIETECPACKKMITSDLNSNEVQCSECKIIVLQRHINSTEYQED